MTRRSIYNVPRKPERVRETLLMNPAFNIAADHIASHKSTLLERWRTLIRSDPTLPEQRLAFTVEQLDDHLPALLDKIIEALSGTAPTDESIRGRGAQHGRVRRSSGYSITQVIWEFSIFRRLLRETVEELDDTGAEPRFAVRERITEVADRSEIGSVQQYVDDATQERDAAREELRHANEQKERFLAVLSHELRNPLASITTAVHIARAPGNPESKRHRALEIIERQANHQRRLVDDLLDVNRISRGTIQLQKETIDLRKTIEAAIETYLPAFEAKAINFRFTRPDQQMMVWADATRIEQIVSNLIANALKFTRASGSIQIELAHEERFAVIRVRDTGSGIEPGNVTQIFDLFVQIQHPDNAGLGIGLWLAKTLVEMHGGTIEAASEGSDKGTEVTVRLPLSEDARRVTASAKLVLVVEDDPEQRELLVMALSEMDAEVTGAKDGSEAIKLAYEHRFDVCILDLNLPDMTGYDLLKRLLEIHHSNRPATVALTGFGRPEDAERVKHAGFDYHMIKPADIAQLQAIISGQASHDLPEQ
jgi:signal transduction histidine kinase/ActR/RegA family two-component response regulator